ncbi:MAG TPA: endonuclease III [Polyangiaceae bacterium]
MAAPKKAAAKKKPAAKKAPPRPKLVPHEQALRAFDALAKHHHDAHCELDHGSPFQLLCATVLSAQSTDVMVNKVTPGLFAAHPDAASMAEATPEQLEALVNRLGMYRQKSKNLVGLAKKLVEKHTGEVPRTLPELVELPGVGRKTANVVLGVCFGNPEGVVVDTHVMRVAQRLGWTRNTDAADIEQDLCKLLPRRHWDRASHVLIFHGRRICGAERPKCEECPVKDLCPSAFNAEKVGRKPPRVRTR